MPISRLISKILLFSRLGGPDSLHPALLERVQRGAEAAGQPRPHGAVEQRQAARPVLPQAQEEDDLRHAGLAPQVGDGERLLGRLLLAGEFNQG